MRLRWRLKSKLALVMVIAVLIPLALVSAMAMQVVQGRLQRGLDARARETSRVATNLLLRQVQRVSQETRALAGAPELHDLLARKPLLVPRYLEEYGTATRWALFEIADERGQIVGRWSPDAPVFERLPSAAMSASLAKALDYEHDVTFVETRGQLMIRAAAPIVDGQFVRRGAAVVTVPFDQYLAEFIKGVLGAEVGFLVKRQPLASTFIKASGERLSGVAASSEVAAQIGRGGAAQTVAAVGGREFSLAFSPLQTAEGHVAGMLVVGLDRGELARTQASALRSLLFGGALALVFAVWLALVLGRRITTPLYRLQRETQAIAAGDLARPLAVETDDEIGELARSFAAMTEALQQHQERLNARIRELSTLHQISHAVSSVLSLDDVLGLVVGEAAEVLAAPRVALLLADERQALQLQTQIGFGDVGLPEEWAAIAREVVAEHRPAVAPRRVAVPLETREHPVGALVLARDESGAPFAEGDLRLLVTFADQAATAIDNARLYAEVRALSEQLERKVELRTAELRTANEELGHALAELKNTQSQLIHSERMAGIGGLVAGVAHEINTPAGAIQGMAQVLGETLERMVGRMCRLLGGGATQEDVVALVDRWNEIRRGGQVIRLRPPAEVRRRARELAQVLEQRGVGDASRRLGRRLVEADLEALHEQVADLAARGVDVELLVGMVEDLAFIDRSAKSIQTAIGAVVRIVRALRNYAHADREAVSLVDLAEGLETTLTILHNQLRYGINVVRKYAPLPKVAVYVDDLNQVWTNLIHNAVQAMKGKGELIIETFADGDEVGVRISDDGPGIPSDVLPRIFEPFFSTKPRGDGVGLGLGIARQIVEKHGGQIAVESRPGRTAFTVVLPLAGPPGERAGG